MKNFNAGKTKYLKYVNWILEKVIHEKHVKEPIDWDGAKEILIIDYNAIGDVVMLTPFLNAVRENAPSAKITLVCRYLAEDVLSNQGLVDTFITADRRWLSTRHHVLRDIFEALITIHECRRTNFDIALEPRGDLRDIFYMHFCKASRKIGYTYTGGEYMLTDAIVPNDNIQHIIADKMYFLEQIGCRILGTDAYIPRLMLTDEQKVDNEKFINDYHLNNRFTIGIHPGASLYCKIWKRYPELVVRLLKQFPDAVFLIFTNDKEEYLYDELKQVIPEHDRTRVLNINEDIRKYIQRVAVCDVMICNDSSAGHIAAALGIDVHVVFGPVLAEFARPYSTAKVFTYEAADVCCRPCDMNKCDNQYKCLEKILVDEVFEGVCRNINTRRRE